MKTTKRILAVLLALTLGLALLAPMAMAEDINPVITKSLPGEVYRRTGRTVNLSVDAKLPEGASGTLSYQWYKLKYTIDWAAVEKDMQTLSAEERASLDELYGELDIEAVKDIDISLFADSLGDMFGDYLLSEYAAIPGATASSLSVKEDGRYRVTISCATGEVSAETNVQFEMGFGSTLLSMFFALFLVFDTSSIGGFFSSLGFGLQIMFSILSDYFSGSFLILRSLLNLL